MTEPTSAQQRRTTIATSLSRRQALGLIGSAAGAAVVIGCGAGGELASTTTTTLAGTTSGSGSSSSSPSSGSGTSTTGSCTRAAEETNGPFPADGSNTNNGSVVDVLTDARIIRQDIRSDLDGSDTQAGTPMTLTMSLLNLNGSCAALAGYYVYISHCSAKGNYSQYSGSMNGGDYSAYTFFRGVQVSDHNGQVRFTTIFPGRYSGRATHIHYEVYAPGANVGTGNFTAKTQKATSQLAFPATATDGSGSPYTNTTLYPNSASNNTQNSSDNVFSDGTSTELLTISGDNSSGYSASITVTIAG